MGTPVLANIDPPLSSLESLVCNLDVDTLRAKRLIRQFLETDPEAFLREAIRVLDAQAETPGAQHLLAVLSDGGLLLRVLGAPELRKDHALHLAHAAVNLTPSIDIQIASGLVDLLRTPESTASLSQVTRLLDILADLSSTARIFPSVVRLLRHPNSHIRSKAVLLIGRQSRSAQWVSHRLDDSDSRIRANALESLWDVDTAEARQLLDGFISDPNNRVAGNALLGLYRLGDARVIPEILKIAQHQSALFRSTAAWVMGETGDPRFTEVLASLIRDANPVVRKRAFSALGRIRAAAGRP